MDHPGLLETDLIPLSFSSSSSNLRIQMINKMSFFQAAKDFLDTIAQMKGEIRRTNSFSAKIENLEDRQMMTATGFESPLESEPSVISEVAPEIQVSAVSIRGVNIRINGQDGYISATRPEIKLSAGDYLEVVSVDLHVQDSIENPNGVFALEGYINKIDSQTGPSSIDYSDGRFSSPDSVLPVAFGDLSMSGVDGGWNVKDGWDRVTLSLTQYFENESSSEAMLSIKMQVGTPDFNFGDDVDDFADQPIAVGDEVNIVGSWFNSGEGRFHNYAEVDVFFENENTPSWVGVLVGNADHDGGVSGEFLFPTENGDQFTERWTPDKAGSYRIEFTVDPERLWNESNELDNRIRLEITVSEQASSVDIGNTGGGVVSQDRATGEGFIMYSKQEIDERFTDQKVYKGNADHFVNVRFHDGRWQYDTNDRYVDFEPASTDVLVASVDYSADKIKSLKGKNLQFNGIQLGFADGDLKFKANVWNGQKNYGDFGLTGTTISFHQNSESPVGFRRQLINASEQTEVGSLIGQLKASGGDSETTFQVVGGDQNKKIKVDKNGNVFLADKIDFKSQKSFHVLVEARNGDQVTVAEIVINVLDAPESDSVKLGNFGDGVAFNHRSIGESYIMYSIEDVHDRFTKRSPRDADAEHFIAVVHHEDSWHYEIKGRTVQFTPTDTDVLLAKIDFSDKSIEMLQGQNSKHEGIASGYASGDFKVMCSDWKGWSKHCRLQLSGSTLNLN